MEKTKHVGALKKLTASKSTAKNITYSVCYISHVEQQKERIQALTNRYLLNSSRCYFSLHAVKKTLYVRRQWKLCPLILSGLVGGGDWRVVLTSSKMKTMLKTNGTVARQWHRLWHEWERKKAATTKDRNEKNVRKHWSEGIFAVILTSAFQLFILNLHRPKLNCSQTHFSETLTAFYLRSLQLNDEFCWLRCIEYDSQPNVFTCLSFYNDISTSPAFASTPMKANDNKKKKLIYKLPLPGLLAHSKHAKKTFALNKAHDIYIQYTRFKHWTVRFIAYNY